MLDIVGLTLYFAGFINGGWPFMHAHPEVSAFLFGGLSIPLAVLFVVSVGQRLFLIHRKHVHDQWMYEQQQEWELEQRRSLPLSSLSPVENDDDVKQVSQQFQSGGTAQRNVPLFQGVSSGTPEKVNVGDNCNVIVAYYLADHPGASIREISKKTGYSLATISRTNAWKNR
jgi:hypothetical protein